MALSLKQMAFVREYLVDLNATAAYGRAGYRATGRAAENNASRLLGNAGVKAAIAAATAARAARTEVTADWVVQRLRVEAERAGDGASHGARVKALELLGRHAGMWPAKLDVSVTLPFKVYGFDPEKEG